MNFVSFIQHRTKTNSDAKRTADALQLVSLPFENWLLQNTINSCNKEKRNKLAAVPQQPADFKLQNTQSNLHLSISYDAHGIFPGTRALCTHWRWHPTPLYLLTGLPQRYCSLQHPRRTRGAPWQWTVSSRESHLRSSPSFSRQSCTLPLPGPVLPAGHPLFSSVANKEDGY